MLISSCKSTLAYKYLGFDEWNSTHHNEAKTKKELVRRTQLIFKTELNSKNGATANNMLAIPAIAFSFNIIDWNLREVKRLDIKVRKMMTTHSMHHPKADIHRRYFPRNNGGRGLTQLALSYKISTIDLFRYSVVKEAR